MTGIAPFQRAETETEPEMPQGVEEAIRRATAKDPGDRYRSAVALIAAARAGEDSEVRPTAVLSRDRSERTTVPNASQSFFGRMGGRAPTWALSGIAFIVRAVAPAVLFLLLGSDGPAV